jgi:predicted Holliday junction resolvase-like endonuclease
MKEEGGEETKEGEANSSSRNKVKNQRSERAERRRQIRNKQKTKAMEVRHRELIPKKRDSVTSWSININKSSYFKGTVSHEIFDPRFFLSNIPPWGPDS